MALPHTCIFVDSFNVRGFGARPSGSGSSLRVISSEADPMSASLSKPIHFLTHFHSDHYVGLQENFGKGDGRTLFCTELTKSFVCSILNVKPDVVVPFAVDESFDVYDCLAGRVTVTAIDANHCPGSVILVFEGDFGKHVHTGDFRFYDGLLKHRLLRDLASNQCIDRVFADFTFADPFCLFPTKESSTETFLTLMDSLRCFPVSLLIGCLGAEELVESLIARMNEPIGVSSPKRFIELCIALPDLGHHFIPVFHHKPQCPRRKITNRSRKRKVFTTSGAAPSAAPTAIPRVVIGRHPNYNAVRVKPSTLWFKVKHQSTLCSDIRRPFRDEFGVWRVLWSMHSDFWELLKLITFLKPKSVEPLGKVVGSISPNARNTTGNINGTVATSPFCLPPSAEYLVSPSAAEVKRYMTLLIHDRHGLRVNWDTDKREGAGKVNDRWEGGQSSSAVSDDTPPVAWHLTRALSMPLPSVDDSVLTTPTENLDRYAVFCEPLSQNATDTATRTRDADGGFDLEKASKDSTSIVDCCSPQPHSAESRDSLLNAVQAAFGRLEQTAAASQEVQGSCQAAVSAGGESDSSSDSTVLQSSSVESCTMSQTWCRTLSQTMEEISESLGSVTSLASCTIVENDGDKGANSKLRDNSEQGTEDTVAPQKRRRVDSLCRAPCLYRIGGTVATDCNTLAAECIVLSE